MSRRLENRTALIVGGAAGIGRATAEVFLSNGAILVIADKDASALEQTEEELKACEKLLTFKMDVTDTDCINSVLREIVLKLGRLDTVVNSAGIDLNCPFETMSMSDWSDVLNVNLTGPINVCHAALPLLKASPAASIINIASGAGLLPIANRTAYCAAKAGLIMATKSLALDLAEFGIRANSICPGAIDTALFRSSIKNEAALETVANRYAFGYIGQPIDIANAALFFASDESKYITGTALSVDGGRTFH
jgi:NAD(P)-dependent dehydrogenase (short-subunit alcohol dehydrogenase family)